MDCTIVDTSNCGDFLEAKTVNKIGASLKRNGPHAALEEIVVNFNAPPVGYSRSSRGWMPLPVQFVGILVHLRAAGSKVRVSTPFKTYEYYEPLLAWYGRSVPPVVVELNRQRVAASEKLAEMLARARAQGGGHGDDDELIAAVDLDVRHGLDFTALEEAIHPLTSSFSIAFEGHGVIVCIGPLGGNPVK